MYCIEGQNNLNLYNSNFHCKRKLSSNNIIFIELVTDPIFKINWKSKTELKNSSTIKYNIYSIEIVI